MASHNHLLYLLPLLFALFARFVTSTPNMYPFGCSTGIFNPQCDAVLYHINNAESNLPKEQIASLYSVDISQLKAITRNSSSNQDYLVTVPCSCEDVNGTTGYFYDATYTVQTNDTFSGVSQTIYSGQAWEVGGEQGSFIAGQEVPMHLLCGCAGNNFKNVVTYTVQKLDTLSDIATLLSSTPEDIMSLNKMLIQNSTFIDEGWVLFVPSQM